MIKYKECKCADDCWEEIVVNDDDDYPRMRVIYFHCSCCGTDFRVENFETGKEVFYDPKKARKRT